MTSANYTAPEGASLLIEQKPFVTYNRKLIQGIGINDHLAPTYVNGKNITSYSIWHDMVSRCYSVNCQKKRPTYAECSVSEEWLRFSNFERWFSANYVEGWQLDKDILSPDSKVYSAETCVFVTPALNSLLKSRRVTRKECPMGVTFDKDRQKYRATVSTEGVNRYLGCFTTPLEAHRAYQLAKAYLIETAETHNQRVRAALDLRAARLRDDYANGRITTKL